MTVHTAHPGHRFSTKTAGIALAGAVLAVGAGYGVANYVLDEAPATITEPTNRPPSLTTTRGTGCSRAPTARSAR